MRATDLKSQISSLPNRRPVSPNRLFLCWTRQIFISFGLCWLTAFSSILFSQDSASNFRTGDDFYQELAQPFSGSWSKEGLRTVLSQIQSSRHIGIVLDRRIDPSAEHPIEIVNDSVRRGLKQIAHVWNGEISTPQNVVYVGPRSATVILRSLIQLRIDELASKVLQIPIRRRAELQNRRTIKWGDLDTASEIITTISREAGLTISNPALVPHDLFVAAELPSVTVIESLSLMLIQFDLTFQWDPSGKSITLIPIPSIVLLERRYRSKQRATEAISTLRQKDPDLAVTIDKDEIVIRAHLEQHDAVEAYLRGKGSGRPAAADTLQPIRLRQFTFNSNQPVPIRNLIQKLVESGILFEYEIEELNRAGIDLDQPVKVDVKNATATEFFQAIFGKSGIEFQFDRDKVKLKPKDPSKK